MGRHTPRRFEWAEKPAVRVWACRCGKGGYVQRLSLHDQVLVLTLEEYRPAFEAACYRPSLLFEALRRSQAAPH